MKIITLTIVSILFSLHSICQDIVYFKVTNYTLDGVNYDEFALEEDIALSFYQCSEEELCFANIWRRTSSQSYGGVYSLTSKKNPATVNSFAYDEYKFTWDFLNSYDDIQGKAAVTFTKIYIGEIIKFSASILVLNTNQLIELTGYKE